MPGRFSIADLQRDTPAGNSGRGSFRAEDIQAPKALTLDQRQGRTTMGHRPGEKDITLEEQTEQIKRDMPGLGHLAAAPVDGAMQIGRGIKRLQEPGIDAKAGGTSDIVRGLFGILTPYLPGAAASGPLRFILAAGSAEAGSKIAGETARAAGAPEGVVELAETAGGVLGGGAGAKVGPKVVAKAGARVAKAARAVKAKTASALSGPGTPAIKQGAREIAIGGAATAGGAPYLGNSIAADGAIRAVRGIRENLRANTPPGPTAEPVPMDPRPVAPAPAPPRGASPTNIEPDAVPSMPVRMAQIEAPPPPPPAPAPAQWDPSTLPPDPIRSTPWYQEALANMRARRINAPAPPPEPPATPPESVPRGTVEPSTINPEVTPVEFRPVDTEPSPLDRPGARDAAEALRAALSDDEQADIIRNMRGEAPAQDLAGAVRDLSPQMRTETAKANYRALKEQGEETGAPAGEMFKAAARANKAQAMADYLAELGKSPEQASKMNAKQWADVAAKSGQRAPSMKTIEEVVFQMRKSAAGSKTAPLEGLAYGSKYYRSGKTWYESLSWRDPRGNGMNIARNEFGPWKKLSGDDAAAAERMYRSGRIAKPGAPWPPEKP